MLASNAKRRIDMNKLSETIKNILLDNKFFILSEQKIPYGVRFNLLNGAILNIYDKGKYCFQGKNVGAVSKLLKGEIK